MDELATVTDGNALRIRGLMTLVIGPGGEVASTERCSKCRLLAPPDAEIHQRTTATTTRQTLQGSHGSDRIT